MTDLIKWADKAMYEAAPLARDIEVQLVYAHQDPLGAIASASMMYEGKPFGDLRHITNEQRVHYFEEMTKTKLTAPLEFIDVHFLISGVTRAFTHQMVRQRTAVYAQESLRFAVKENFAEETPLPPSLRVLPEKDPKVQAWRDHMQRTQEVYMGLIANGIPAEDARGLLPHQTTTRLHYKTNLRNLVDHAGNRLCTQAQFEWKIVFFKMMDAMRKYASFLAEEWTVRENRRTMMHDPNILIDDPDQYEHDIAAMIAGTAGIPLAATATGNSTNWQWSVITDPKYKFFAPACYAAGRCPFKADFDRGCTIRERADRGAFDEIRVEEWAADPRAAIIPPKEGK